MSDSDDNRGPTVPCVLPPLAAVAKWQRLTILDLLLMMLSFGVAGSFLTSTGLEVYLTRADLLLWIVVLGSSLAAIFVLTTQYVFRHRRKWPSVGEWLWPVPSVLPAFDLGGPQHVGVLIACSCLALTCLICRACGFWGAAPCRWTDAFGCLTCLSIGVMAILGVIVHFVTV
jgi:hypothetical protein